MDATELTNELCRLGPVKEVGVDANAKTVSVTLHDHATEDQVKAVRAAAKKATGFKLVDAEDHPQPKGEEAGGTTPPAN